MKLEFRVRKCCSCRNRDAGVQYDMLLLLASCATALTREVCPSSAVTGVSRRDDDDDDNDTRSS
jgi:hypothetical protein